jgi:serine/threonine protein kinase
MGEPRRRCSSCGESYAEGVIFCPRDGSALSLRHADAGPDPYLGRTLADEFRIDALIGTGAVGRVYRAHQRGVERSVALKIMHRDLAVNEALQSRFRREARLAGSLSHPNLASVLSLGELLEGSTPVPFLVLEFLDGISLRSALSAAGALGPARSLHILLQIADALGEAHQRGIVHRDLKPENVMLVQRGQDYDFVKVLDFGVARAGVADPSLATHAGAIFGSARYVAPECAAGGSSSPSSDVYALATMAYECLAGRTPFDGENAVQILLKQQSAPVPPLLTPGAQAIPRELASFIERNLGKAPDERAADANVFARELMLAAREAGLDPGLSSRTRRGHAVLPISASAALSAPALGSAPGPTASFTPAHDLPSLAPPQPSATRRALFVLVCFALGAGAALGIATRLGAFADRASATANGGAR